MFVSRGVLVLDENLKALEGFLKARNFKVQIISLDANTVDAADWDVYQRLAHRVFVTEHPRGFFEAAVINEFSIIATEDSTAEPERMAEIISREWLAGSLRLRQPFIARIGADGSVTVREIEDSGSS